MLIAENIYDSDSDSLTLIWVGYLGVRFEVEEGKITHLSKTR